MIESSAVDQSHTEAIGRLIGELEKYAGWLGKDRASTSVRTAVKALRPTTSTAGAMPTAAHLLQAEIDHLQPGSMRTLLRKTLSDLRLALRDGQGQ